MKKKFIFLTMMLLTLMGGVKFNVLNAQNAQETITIGSGDEKSTNTPFDIYNTYGICQIVYTPEDINNYGAANIVGFALKFYGVTNSNMELMEGANDVTRNFRIYLQNTDMTSLSSYTPVSGSTLCYEGNKTLVNDNWTSFEFTESFPYEGESILVTIVDNSGYQAGSNWYTWYVDNINNRCVNGSPAASFDASSSYTLNESLYIPYSQLTFEAGGVTPDPDPEPEPEPTIPAAPEVTAEALSATEIFITWDAVNGATSYNIYFNDEVFTTTGTEYTVRNLTANTNYTITVTAVNAVGESDHSIQLDVLTYEEGVNPFEGKQFRIKVNRGDANGQYLNIFAYNTNSEGNMSSVGTKAKEDTDYQIFIIEEAGNGNYYLKNTAGYYIKCAKWNVDAYSKTEKTALTFEYESGSDGPFYLRDSEYTESKTNNYFKVEWATGGSFKNNYHVYCDQPITDSKVVTWTLEEVVFSATATTENYSIFDDQTTTLSVTAIDGSGNYTYSWSHAEDLNDATSANPTFTPTAIGEHTFTCTVTDTESGSTAEASVTVYVNARPELQLAVSANKELIYNDGETAVLTATVTEGTGYAPYTYSWSPAEDLNDATSANPTFTPTATGEYTLTCTVTDARSNTQTVSKTIEVKDVSERPLEIVIGSDGTTDVYNMLPLYTYYNRSITQQIYTAEELGGNELNITSISFEVVSKANDEGFRNVEVYLVNTDKGSFTSETDMVNLTDNDKYYTGQLQFNTNGWIELELSKPFEYTGNNLLICVVNDNDNYFSAPSFRVYKTVDYRSLLYYKDSEPKYDHKDVNGNSQYSTSSQYCNYNNNVIKLGYEIPVPKPENLVATPAQIYVGETINLTWDEPEGAVSYNIYVDGVLNGTTEELPYELSGLTYNVEPGHTIEVSAVYEDDTESGKSNTVTVQVAGSFNLVLNVKDNESNPIAEAMVTITGYDEFDVQKNYEFTTDENGMVEETLPLPLKGTLFSIEVSKAPYKKGYSEVTNNDWGGYVENGSTVTPDDVILQLTGVNQIDTDKEYYDENEPITLMWGPVENATYNVYVNEDETPINAAPLTTTTYTLEDGLQYKEYGNQVYVSAVYTIGESDKGYGTQVKVNGYGTVSGTVTDDDTNPIKGASIVITGQDEYYQERTFTFTTAENGTFEGSVVFGYDYTATVSKYGYEEVTIENVVVTSASNAYDFNVITLSPIEAQEATIKNLVAEINNDNVVVSWEAEYARYNVHRKDAAENYEQLGDTTANTYTDESWATLENGEYTYGVSAFIEGEVGTIIEEHFEGDSYDAPAGWSWTENWSYQQYPYDASRGRSIISYLWVGVYDGKYYLKPSTPVSTANSTLTFDYLFEDYGYAGTSELAVYYATSSDGPWTNSLFYETSETKASGTWHSATIDLRGIEEGPIYLAFCHIDNGFGPLYIDNIVVTGTVVTESSIVWASPLTKNDANVFTGTSAWTSATNWSNGVPADGANVFIKGNVTIASNVTVNNMTINGGSVTINNGASLTVEGTLVNEAAANLVINDGAQIFQNNEDVPATFVMGITKPEEWQSDNTDGWQFISSPFTDALVSNFTNASEGNYDLFKYDGDEDLEWRNHKADAASFGKTFEQGVGYLASHETESTIELTGTLNAENYHSWNDFYYDYDKPLANFHLLGNPFSFNMKWSNVTATNLASGYAVVNETGGYTYLGAADDEIAVGDGFFVQAIAAGTDPASLSYGGRGAKSEKSNSLNITATGNAGKDNVVINFAGKSEGFNKLQNFNDAIATVYVAEDGKNYGIYNCDADVQEVELNFNANKMGNYTISIEPNGEFETVTLVDRFTGVETNMLEGEYTFTAMSSDNHNRFIVRMVYGQQSTDDSHFVYQSGEELILNIQGEVQIVDVLGRVVYNGKAMNDINRINVSSFNSGAYMVRVVNGNDVKVEKVVIY